MVCIHHPPLCFWECLSIHLPIGSTHGLNSLKSELEVGARNNTHGIKHSLNKKALQMLQSRLIIHHGLLN
ncbi:hypothetical protein YERSI8AC_220225 [Enterobacterales bacterium 8AC]|nr:hypothetical protein YERSI8AC_220225 [Enterobacterales bacterium 8AC]